MSTQRKEAPRPQRVALWNVETGERIERWPVDAKGMVRCGEFVTDPAELPEGVTGEAAAAPKAEGDAQFTGGYYIESTDQGWHKAFGPDGEQIGKSQRSYEAAAELIPAIHHAGAAQGVPTEHSPGVALNADDGTGGSSAPEGDSTAAEED